MNFQNLLLKITDALFPPSAEHLCVRALSDANVLTYLRPHHFNTSICLSAYTNKYIRALIHEAKFHHNDRAFSLLGTLFLDYYNHVDLQADIIIPIPLSAARMRARGYNQVTQILQSQARTPFASLIRTDILVRSRDTKPQTELGRDERLRNVQNAFSCRKPTLVTGKRIIIVDDVTTTGTTLNEARKELLRYAPKTITCIALAH